MHRKGGVQLDECNLWWLGDAAKGITKFDKKI
jgi:hypothetical protein